MCTDFHEAAFLHDWELHPVPGKPGGLTHYANGDPLWQGSEAAEKLEEDFKNEKHVGLSRAEFKATRPCYKDFSAERITQRLDWHKQGTKEVGQTPGKAKEKKKCGKQPQYKPEISRKDMVDPYVKESPLAKKKKRIKY